MSRVTFPHENAVESEYPGALEGEKLARRRLYDARVRDRETDRVVGERPHTRTSFLAESQAGLVGWGMSGELTVLQADG